MIVQIEAHRDRHLSRALPDTERIVPLARYVMAHAPSAQKGLIVLGHMHRTMRAEQADAPTRS